MSINKFAGPISDKVLATGFLLRVARKVPVNFCRQVLPVCWLTIFTVSCDNQKQPQNKEPGRKELETVIIDNVKPRRDVAGEIIDAHDGCLQRFNGRFYLYGTSYGNSDGFTNNSFRVYSSPDLGKWTLEGELLKERPPGIYGRPYVVFNPNTRKYVLWYNWYPKLLDNKAGQWNGQAAVATSDTPTGPFKVANPNVPLSKSHPGDGSLFVDDDGKGYFIYTAIDEGYGVRVERLMPDYLGSTGEASSVLIFGAEAPVLFRRNNLYYALCGPRCAFCPEGSEVNVFISFSPMGPFYEAPNINRHPESGGPTQWTQQTYTVDVPGGKFVIPLTNNTHHYQNNAPAISAQETWVAKIPTAGGQVFFIWMADHWGSASDGIKAHDFQFWSMPLKFNPDDTIQPIKNIAQWGITWSWGD